VDHKAADIRSLKIEAYLRIVSAGDRKPLSALHENKAALFQAVRTSKCTARIKRRFPQFSCKDIEQEHGYQGRD
jgi:hypothetical protein